jgi:hypothetical protein
MGALELPLSGGFEQGVARQFGPDKAALAREGGAGWRTPAPGDTSAAVPVVPPWSRNPPLTPRNRGSVLQFESGRRLQKLA